MNYNDYAATEIMGWKKESLPDPFSEDGGLVWDYVAPDCSREFSVDSWHPDTDRNQLWLVLEKFDADVCTTAANALWPTLPHESQFRRLGSLGAFYYCAMMEPALALKAICEAHKAGVK